MLRHFNLFTLNFHEEICEYFSHVRGKNNTDYKNNIDQFQHRCIGLFVFSTGINNY
jgi:hypothetical protein